MSEKTVVVTGGAGYIGSMLTEALLKAGYRVRVVDRFFFGDTLADLRDHPNLECIETDIRTVSSAPFEGVYAVMDLAALSNDPAGDLDAENTFDINHRGRARICSLAHENGVERYILASSCSLYGFQDHIVDENSELNPLTTYAVANRRAEEAAFKHYGSPLCVTALRQATVYGASRRTRFDLAVSGITLSIYTDGIARLQRDGMQWRPMVHVRDIARAFIAVLEAKRELVDGQIFNVGSDVENVQLLPLAERIAKVADVPLKIDWYGDPDVRSYRVSFAKINETLGFQPQFTIEDGVQELLQRLSVGSLRAGPTSYTVKWYKHLLEQDPAALSARPGEGRFAPGV